MPEDQGGITFDRRVNIQSLNDITDAERGIDVAKQELDLLIACATSDQKSVYNQIIYEMKTNSVTFLCGAAGSGKSFLLKMFERHYKINGYKVRVLEIKTLQTMALK